MRVSLREDRGDAEDTAARFSGFCFGSFSFLGAGEGGVSFFFLKKIIDTKRIGGRSILARKKLLVNVSLRI